MAKAIGIGIGEGLDGTLYPVYTFDEYGERVKSLGWAVRSKRKWLAISAPNIDRVGGPFTTRRDAIKFLSK